MMARDVARVVTDIRPRAGAMSGVKRDQALLSPFASGHRSTADHQGTWGAMGVGAALSDDKLQLSPFARLHVAWRTTISGRQGGADVALCGNRL